MNKLEESIYRRTRLLDDNAKVDEFGNITTNLLDTLNPDASSYEIFKYELIDDVEWYATVLKEKKLADENAYFFASFYLVWILKNDMYNIDFFHMKLKNAPKFVEAIQEEVSIPVEFYKKINGQFPNILLNEEGFNFTRHYFCNYYNTTNTYYSDFTAILDPKEKLELEGNWKEYHKIKKIIDKRYKKWKKIDKKYRKWKRKPIKPN